MPESPAASVTTMMVKHDLECREIGALDSEYLGHISLTPFFSIVNHKLPDVIQVIEETARQVEPFPVYPLRYSLYGPDQQQPVVEIADPGAQLKKIHQTLLQALGKIGCKFKKTPFKNERYAPHTRQLSFALMNEYWVDTLSVISCPGRNSRILPRISHVFDLGGLTNEAVDSQLSESLVQ